MIFIAVIFVILLIIDAILRTSSKGLSSGLGPVIPIFALLSLIAIASGAIR